MDLGALRTLTRDLNFAVLGMDATVIRASTDTEVATRAIWLTPPQEDQGAAPEFRRRDGRKALAVPRSDSLPDLPQGSQIYLADELGASPRWWRVDGLMSPIDTGFVRVFVIPVR